MTTIPTEATANLSLAVLMERNAELQEMALNIDRVTAATQALADVEGRRIRQVVAARLYPEMTEAPTIPGIDGTPAGNVVSLADARGRRRTRPTDVAA